MVCLNANFLIYHKELTVNPKNAALGQKRLQISGVCVFAWKIQRSNPRPFPAAVTKEMMNK